MVRLLSRCHRYVLGFEPRFVSRLVLGTIIRRRNVSRLHHGGVLRLVLRLCFVAEGEFGGGNVGGNVVRRSDVNGLVLYLIRRRVRGLCSVLGAIGRCSDVVRDVLGRILDLVDCVVDGPVQRSWYVLRPVDSLVHGPLECRGKEY